MKRLLTVFTTYWGWTLGVASLLYGFAATLVGVIFRKTPFLTAIPYDLALCLALALPFSAVFRSRRMFVLVFGLFTLFLHAGHAAKVAILGAPMAPDDIYSLRSLFLIIAPWQRTLMLLVAALAGFAVLRGLGLGKSRHLAGFGTLLAMGMALTWGAGPLLNWMDRRFGYVDWDAAGDYQRRGPTIHSLQEITRFLMARQPIPTAGEVAAVLRDRKVFPMANQPASRRNVHMIVLESFWDAGLLKSLLDGDPLPADFRELWAQTGQSHTLSPVFGGYTANAEFEALCGFPVAEPLVRFERNLTQQVPCLPTVLGDSGYRRVASHPNIPTFWNRLNVYKRIGFDTFWAGADFVYDDMNGDYLSDRSLYRQVLEKIDPLLAGDKPLFNYVLTFFGHLPYPLSADRPLVFKSRSVYPDVAAYASTLHYKARELMVFLAELRKRDPDGLIVIFGDHLPVLAGFEAYIEAGLVARDRADYTPQMYLTMAATPLVIIDGKNGPVPMGDLPTYRLPELVLQLLGNNSRTLLAYTAPPPGLQIRPLVGMHLNLARDGVEPCLSEPFSATCRLTADWLGQTQILANDLFVGAQYASPDKLPAVFAEPAPVEMKAEVNLPKEEPTEHYPPAPPASPVVSTGVI